MAAPATEDREKNDGYAFMWKDYPSKLFNMIRMRHPRVKLLILVNDPYDPDVCIKDSEHDRHNAKKALHLWHKKHCRSERMMHIRPARVSVTFSRINHTRFAFNSS